MAELEEPRLDPPLADCLGCNKEFFLTEMFQVNFGPDNLCLCEDCFKQRYPERVGHVLRNKERWDAERITN